MNFIVKHICQGLGKIVHLILVVRYSRIDWVSTSQHIRKSSDGPCSQIGILVVAVPRQSNAVAAYVKLIIGVGSPRSVHHHFPIDFNLNLSVLQIRHLHIAVPRQIIQYNISLVQKVIGPIVDSIIIVVAEYLMGNGAVQFRQLVQFRVDILNSHRQVIFSLFHQGL